MIRFTDATETETISEQEEQETNSIDVDEVNIASNDQISPLTKRFILESGKNAISILMEYAQKSRKCTLPEFDEWNDPTFSGNKGYVLFSSRFFRIYCFF